MQEMSKYLEESPVKLDLKDKKILLEMDFNARIPYSQLAKKVGLSKQGAEYKVNNLIKKGVVGGFYPVINVPKLGYIYCRLLVTLQNTSKEKQEEIIEYLTSHNKVFWLFKMHGIYDVLIVVWAKSVTDFKDFVDELENKYGENIKRKTETITTDVVHFQHRYLLGVERTKEIHIKETSQRIKIDEVDKKILNILCSDGRMPLVEISQEVGESAKVAGYRVRKLEEKKLIEGYRPIINHNKIGYTYYKVFINLNRISKEELKKLKLYIKGDPIVIYIVEGVGLPGDLDIEVMVRSNQQLFDFIEELKFRFPTLIGEYQTVIFMDTLKVKYLPFEYIME
ncbi:MAG: winged helix-turn-helix transcriptional regulator [archaeon]|nr:winged helix-turn-helix transcriptional regulator [archaeon]